MQDGRLLFGHYALMPNRLGYCGGSDDKALFDYCVTGEADQGTEHLIRQFQAAYPYLKFIAESNDITSPFEPRVVEAYWVGNDLLEQVQMSDFYRYLEEKISPRVPKKAMKHLLGKVPDGAHPHHSFHVLDVSMRTGALKECIDDLNNCRISWGAVERVEGDELVVLYQPLVLQEGLLALGESVQRRVFFRVQGRGYLNEPMVGKVVSMHWNWACDVLSPQQAKRLERQSLHHIALANQTI